MQQDLAAESLACQLKEALGACGESIPVILVGFNNGAYLEHSVHQLNERGVTPIVIDNHSSCSITMDVLKGFQRDSKALVAWSPKNYGHLVGFLDPFYGLFPDFFAYSDPDLQFNPELPQDFLGTLKSLTIQFHAFKAGFALQLEGCGELITRKTRILKEAPFAFDQSYSVLEHEARFWLRRLAHPSLEVYAAPIDTTFAVINKHCYRGYFLDGVRVGGAFTAIHLPWFPDLDLFDEETIRSYRRDNLSTTWT